MASISPDSDGVVEVRENNSEQIANAIRSGIAAALEEIGLAAERFAKAACPVDTGRLRNSITHALDMGEEAVYVGTNVEYGVYVHEGVHGRPGIPFLRDAATNHVGYYRKILERHLKG